MPDVFAHAAQPGGSDIPRLEGLFLGWPVARESVFYVSSNEDNAAVIGPPGYGKTSGVFTPAAMIWDGALIAANTSSETLRATRTRRLELAKQRSGGDVLVYAPGDGGSHIDGVRRIHWSPLDGCQDAVKCTERVSSLIGPEPDIHGSGAFFRDITNTLLCGYFHAAALGGRSIRDVLVWLDNGECEEPARIIRSHAGQPGVHAPLADSLESAGGAAAGFRSDLLSSAFHVLAGLRHSSTALETSMFSDFDVTRLVESGSTLYVVSAAANQQVIGRLIAALIEAIVSNTRELAFKTRTGRVDPPLLLLLDEVASIAPLPTLPSILSTGRKSGIVCMWSTQSMARMRSSWGDDGAKAIHAASTHKLIFGGIGDARYYEEISRPLGASTLHGEHLYDLEPARALLVGARAQHGSFAELVATPPAHMTPPFA